MQKTLLASALAVTLGSAATVQAATITITNMVFPGFPSPFAASGTMNDSGNGTMTSVDSFVLHHWTADQQIWFDTHSTLITWSGTGTSANAADSYGNYNYTFHLENNQVAAGTFFDWNGNNNIPVLTIYDCATGGPGGACTGNSEPMQTAPFPGQEPQFNGSTAMDFPVSGPVPVPAAVWLMGSGLLGLVGIARRRKQS